MAGRIKGMGHGNLPPMLEQYIEMRDQYADYLLLFQVGDFYETFGEDAERLARLLGISLTHKTSKDFSTAMAGIPLRAADMHIEKLLKLGTRVAIADQVGETGQGLVERKVSQLLSPGTLVDERMLQADENYLAAVATGDGYALALLDLSTGEFRCAAVRSRGALYDELARQRPAELLLAPEITENPAWLKDFQSRFPLMYSQARFGLEESCALLEQQFGRIPDSLDSSALIRACGAVLNYARFSLQGELSMVQRLQRYEPGAHLHLSESALTALEIFKANSSQGQTVLGVLSHTRTAAGRRRLRAWLKQPLLSASSIQQRLDAVEQLVIQADMRESIRSALYRAHDLERLAARVSSGRALPREVAALARTLELLPELEPMLHNRADLLESLRVRLTPMPDVVQLIRSALVDDPPIKLGEGGLIRDGFSAELDQLRLDALGGREWMAQLEQDERERSGIHTLKVGYNNVLGYYLEAPLSQQAKIPSDYRQIATLKDRARYSRPDLREREQAIQRAEQCSHSLEQQVFQDLRLQLSQYAEALSSVAGALAELDVLSALALISAERGWIRPQASPKALCLIQAKHPVVEQALGDRFIPNDALLSPERHMLLITGPNMAGKSTYLRTVALCALLHQIGCFVPADHAELPIFDAIHTRIGASDDLAGGRSTFMVEMSELSHILHQSSANSLIILDEIGRGTSTLDGLAIAWASLEHLQALGAYTLFATHYFELTRLAGQLSGVVNLHVAAEEEAGQLVFYHQLLEGPASQSYGVGVARLAGLPQTVTQRASELLNSMQAQQQGSSDDILRQIASLDLSRISPLEATMLLYKWQDRLK